MSEKIKWTALETEDQIRQIAEESKEHPVLIFKHSTTCNISQMALNRLERNWNPEVVASVKPYYLDLRAHRSVSSGVASFFDVEHQSPQMIIIKDGKAVQVSSHMSIDFNQVKTLA